VQREALSKNVLHHVAQYIPRQTFGTKRRRRSGVIALGLVDGSSATQVICWPASPAALPALGMPLNG